MNLATFGAALAAAFWSYYVWLALSGLRKAWSERVDVGGLRGLIWQCVCNLIRCALGLAACVGALLLIGAAYTVYFFMTL